MSLSKIKYNKISIQIAIKRTSIGYVLIGLTPKGICSILIGDSADEVEKDFLARFPYVNIELYDDINNELINKTLHVIENKENHNIPIDLINQYGTDFQKNVWKIISEIPYGKTISYSDIGKKINSKAFRAIGTACANNPIAIIIPCHRVVNSNGNIGKYRWGINRKIELLRREGIKI